MKYIRMSLFYLVKENYGIWFPSDFLGELSALFIADIPGGALPAVKRRIFHIFTHIYLTRLSVVSKRNLASTFAS